jgi:hypothetical protein
MGVGPRDVPRRDLDGSFVISPHDADQVGIVGGKFIGVRLQAIDKFFECGIDETLMRKAFQHRQLPIPRYGAAPRHIGALVPGEHRPRRVEIVNLRQPVLQVGKGRVGRLPVHRPLQPPHAGRVQRSFR